MIPTRRSFLLRGASVAAATALTRGFSSQALFAKTLLTGADDAKASAITPMAALERLQAGNARFVAGKSQANNSSARRTELAKGQHPIATILSCSDSRVPPETVFDEGLGDIFIIRLAGNVFDDDAQASIEYSVAVLGVPLIVVLGHSSCGAVKAALDVRQNKTVLPGKLPGLASRIIPAVDAAIAANPKDTGDALLNACIRANVMHGMDGLGAKDPVIGPAISSGKVKIAGGIYSLPTGKVDWLFA
jgi:carbonic anhydrase